MADSLSCTMPLVAERLVCDETEELHTPSPREGEARASAPDSERPSESGRDTAPALLPSMLRAAVSCSGRLDNVVLALLQAQASPLSAIVSGIKAGYELGRCMANERDAELQLQAELHAVQECQARGGTPDELSQTTLTCVMPAPTGRRP